MIGGSRVPRAARSWRVVRLALTVGSAGALLLGCTAEAGDLGTPVPTFDPGADASSAAGPPRTDFTVTLGRDCAPALSPGDLGALFGMPLDTVAVRSTIGVAQPAVGRTERLACHYTGTAGGPARGATLLDINIGRYVDAAAAAAQWGINAGVESGERRDLAIGAATAALFDRPRESVLMVVYDDTTLTMVLPARPLPDDRPPGDLLVDIALRVLAVVEPPPTSGAQAGPTPTPASLPSGDPAVASGE